MSAPEFDPSTLDSFYRYSEPANAVDAAHEWARKLVDDGECLTPICIQIRVAELAREVAFELPKPATYDEAFEEMVADRTLSIAERDNRRVQDLVHVGWRMRDAEVAELRRLLTLASQGK